MISVSLSTIYGIGLGITIAVMLIIRATLIFLGVKSKRKHWLKTLISILLWPLTWVVVIHTLWKLYKEETRHGRQRG